MKIALGTVQIGMRYGIANASGQVDREDAVHILNLAMQAGVDTLDTAVVYGNSEARLGELCSNNWKVVSKLPELPQNVGNVEAWVEQQVRGSLARLRIQQLDGILMHKPSDILGPNRLAYSRALTHLRNRGLARSIGYSIYSPDDLAELCDAFVPDLVQAPFSLIDRRLESSGWLSTLVREGVRIHTRSTFLQGLLLVPENSRPSNFTRWQPLWQAWSQACADLKCTPLELSLGFVLSRPTIERVVVGVDNSRQLKEILAVARRSYSGEFPQIESKDLDLIDPSRWSVA